MTKRAKSDRMTLNEAVKLIMKRRKCSREQAEAMLLKALQSGALTAYGVWSGNWENVTKQ